MVHGKGGVTEMKISSNESGKASAHLKGAQEKILPENRPRRSGALQERTSRQLSPLERGMEIAEEALKHVPDVRESVVEELKERVKKGEYKIKGEEVADMMMRRLSADRIR
jgi:negative regulator of flagellin synthesis FlgM